MLDVLAEQRPANTVVITGDSHENSVRNVPPDFRSFDGTPVATEFMGTSITTEGYDPAQQRPTFGGDPNNPHRLLDDYHRGYVKVRLGPAAVVGRVPRRRERAHADPGRHAARHVRRRERRAGRAQGGRLTQVASVDAVELGIYTFAELTPTRAADRRAPAIADLIEEIELADQVGLDVFGVGEHHRPDFAVSAPAVVLAAAAARTERIRLTSAVTVLSSDDPVRVFQDFATLDLLSGGRAEIMAGRGSFIESFPLFGYDLDDYDELFAEKLELLLELRDGERVTWSGRAPRPDRRPRRLPAAGPGPAADLGRGRRQPAVRRARRRARPADGARDHRRRCRSASRRSPSCTARGRARPGTTRRRR